MLNSPVHARVSSAAYTSLDLMRTLTAIMLVLIARCASAAPEVIAPVSKQDVAQISYAVRAATRAPLVLITPVFETKPVPGAIPRKTVELRSIGRGRVSNIPTIRYERTDRVSVTTGDTRKHKGDVYLLERSAAKWRIIHKSEWIR